MTCVGEGAAEATPPAAEVQAQGPVGEFGNMWYHVLPGTVHVYIGNGDLTSEADVTLTIYYSSHC